MKKDTPIEYAAQIGLDWSDRKHDFCIKIKDKEALEYGVVKHDVQEIEDWALALQKRFQNQPIAICLELKAGPVVYALLKYSFIVLYPIPPKALAKYREAFTQSGAKDDPSDAYLQMDYLVKHPEAVKPLVPDSPETRILQSLVEDRKDLVCDKVRLTNRITAAVKNYFPQLLQWFDDIDTQLFCNFVTKWPTLEQVRRARKDTIRNFFIANRSVRKSVIEKRLALIKEAIPLTEDQAVILPKSQLVGVLVVQLSEILQAISQYDREIARRFREHTDYVIFDSLPGAGPVYAPRLLAAFGADRDRFSSAEEVSRMSGIAPVLNRSGKSAWVHWRYSCPKFMRQTFVEWAYQSKQYSYWAKEFYDKKRAQGMDHQAALRALAFKWIRIVYRCWKDRTCYDESTYLFALKKREAAVG